MWPKVSIIWLNYNSMKVLDLVLRSLEAIADLDYSSSGYELIVVDNGSTDGSFEKIKEFLDKKSGLRKKLIRLEKNLGFTGGCNVGYKARDKESKYIALINNDAIPLQNSLKDLAEYAEKFSGVGGLSGIILKYDGVHVDTAGDFVDELLITYPVGSEEVYPWITRKAVYTSYVDGSYALYSVDAINKCIGKRIKDKIFIDEFFAYADDYVVGLMMWNCGYKQITIPKPIALHRRSSTFRHLSKLREYLFLRNGVAIIQISNTRYKKYAMLFRIKLIVGRRSFQHKLSRLYSKAVYDGIKLGRKIAKKYGYIDLYKAPIIKLNHKDVLRYYLLGTREKLTSFRRKISVRAVKMFEAED